MLLFWDGFDHYRYSQSTGSTALTFLLNKWTSWFEYGGNNDTGPASVVVAPGLGRVSTTDTLTGGMQMIGLEGSTNNFHNPSNVGTVVFKYLNVNCSTMYFGCAYNYNFISPVGSYTGDLIIAQFQDLGTVQFDLRQTSMGTLYVTRNGTVIGSGTYAMELGVWNYIEVGATLGSSGSVTVRVNGLVVINVSGVNNISSANSYVNGFTVGLGTVAVTNTGSGTMLVDDCYFCDNTTSYNNNFLGDTRIRASFATSMGSLTGAFAPTASLWAASTATAQFTVIEDSNGNAQYAIATTNDTKTGGSPPTWATSFGTNTADNHVTWECLGPMVLWNMVQENAPDNDSSYIFSNTLHDAVTFKYQSATGATVYAVGVCAWCRKDDAGFRSIQLLTLSAGVTGLSGTDIPLSNTYTYAMGAFPLDPNTSSPWSTGAMNLAEFGIDITV